MRIPFLIAEAAATHDGSLERMLTLIETAKHADADAFKTAWWSSPERELIADRASPAAMDTRRCRVSSAPVRRGTTTARERPTRTGATSGAKASMILRLAA